MYGSNAYQNDMGSVTAADFLYANSQEINTFLHLNWYLSNSKKGQASSSPKANLRPSSEKQKHFFFCSQKNILSLSNMKKKQTNNGAQRPQCCLCARGPLKPQQFMS